MSGTATVATAVRSCPAVVAVVAAVAAAAAVVSTAAAVVPDAALSSGQPEGGGGASYVGFPTNSASDTMPGGSPGAANASDPDYAPGVGTGGASGATGGLDVSSSVGSVSRDYA